MNIIINHSSMQPIYEQIMGQIKERIMHGELKEDTALPSVREVEADLEMAIRKGRSCGMSDQEIRELFQIVLED